MKDQLLTFWQARTLRERWLVGGGSLAIALLLAYQFIWLPIGTARNNYEQQATLLKAQLPMLQALNGRLNALPQKTQQKETLTASNLSNELAKSKLNPYTPKLTSSEREYKVHVDSAPLPVLLQTIQGLDKRFSYKMVRADITLIKHPALVRADLVLAPKKGNIS